MVPNCFGEECLHTIAGGETLQVNGTYQQSTGWRAIQSDSQLGRVTEAVQFLQASLGLSSCHSVTKTISDESNFLND